MCTIPVPAGSYLAPLPLEPRKSKLLLYAQLFGCKEAALSMLAAADAKVSIWPRVLRGDTPPAARCALPVSHPPLSPGTRTPLCNLAAPARR